ncbi:hypothetical protein Cgig2_027971 [Carnegiea gigantea]|uniref:F-box domain-containing protein n=1 Tax=Carnegiea gigantea TaxID=171969 RepID=A0A9Q1JUR4_9CARY|nr:hypothetical protein Cgig2_027971 [Carnegiea gigantea]
MGKELIATTINVDKYTPPELWREVLRRLPVKTLLRLRCVCKSWLSIIDDPAFAFLHLTLFNNLPDDFDRVIYKDEGITLRVSRIIYTTLNDVRSVCKLETYCDVLTTIPFQVLGFLIKGAKHNLRLQLWNPWTRKSLLIPRSPIRHPPIIRSVVGFGFVPFSSNNVNIIKVEALDTTPRSHYSNKVDNVAIYSLKSRAWRTKSMDVTSSFTWYFLAHKPPVSGGALHWLALRDDYDHDSGPLATHIASFDLMTEEFSFAQLPCFYEGGDNGRVLAPIVVGGMLGIFDVSPSHICIWVMQKNNDDTGIKVSWTKWYSTDHMSTSEFYQSFKHPAIFCHDLLFVDETGMLFVGCMEGHR